ncbi:hypothetical protein GCM10028787_28810 [Brachybacterium horti]
MERAACEDMVVLPEGECGAATIDEKATNSGGSPARRGVDHSEDRTHPREPDVGGAARPRGVEGTGDPLLPP